MLKFVFVFLLILHGLIHLLGVVKEWKIAKVPMLGGKTLFPLGIRLSKIMGAIWLLLCIVFIVSAGGFLLDIVWWLELAFSAVVVSQILIIIYWRDAWAGTIANVIVVAVLIVLCATRDFNTMVENEVYTIFEKSKDKKTEVTKEMLSGLPDPVRNWLEHSGIVGKDQIHTVRLKQKGMMRSTPEGSWMEFEAEQYFTVDEPAFIWKATVEAFPLINLVARDKYQNGHGNMYITVLSLFPVANSGGKEIDQGTMVRYLAELQWFPTAALNDYVRWESVDSSSARVTMTYGGMSVSGVLQFNVSGDVTGFVAQRYGDFNGTYALETWSISVTGYETFGGIRIPSHGEVTWKKSSGDFTWLKLDVTEIEYNTPAIY